MRFYDALQLDPAVLKPKIRAAETVLERRKLQIALVLRSALIVAFAIALISPVSTLFGAENTPMAVALFCILLGIRFVDFSYCIKDSMVNLAITFLLLLIAPVVADHANPFLAVLIHFSAFFTILLMTCHVPEMGNGGLYSFAYIYLTGNPVTGILFWKRALLTLLGYLLCGAILFVKHRKKNSSVRFVQVVRQFHLSNKKSRWQFRMALGVSLVLTLGNWLQVERFMWMGFACGTLLSAYPYVTNVRERVFQRILGAVAGSLIFFAISVATPKEFHSILGPLGGFCLGFCTDYRYKTAINCLGALMLASGLYGIEKAVTLRIFDTLLGVIFGSIFIFLHSQLVDRRFDAVEEIVQESVN